MNRDDVVDGLVAAGMAQGEAEQTVANWEEVAEETQARIDAARQDLEVAVEEATNAVGSAAIGAFFALLVGAVIAMVGAAAGRPKTVGEAVAG